MGAMGDNSGVAGVWGTLSSSGGVVLACLRMGLREVSPSDSLEESAFGSGIFLLDFLRGWFSGRSGSLLSASSSGSFGFGMALLRGVCGAMGGSSLDTAFFRVWLSFCLFVVEFLECSLGELRRFGGGRALLGWDLVATLTTVVGMSVRFDGRKNSLVLPGLLTA